MSIMYHQESFFYDLTRPYLGRCDLIGCLKIFLKKGSLLQLLFDRLSESKKNKEKNCC